MQIDKQSMVELAQLVAESVVNVLEKRGIVGQKQVNISEKSAYAKTESLLYNYMRFKEIIVERQNEIADIKRYGVPQKSDPFSERVQTSRTVQGIVLPEESVEDAVHRIECGISELVRVIDLIDTCMGALKNDPYYKVLEMRYFEGRTQEDIALEYGVSQVTISNNKNRLVKELAVRIFPNQVIQEYLN